jgi:hypothetical protein
MKSSATRRLSQGNLIFLAVLPDVYQKACTAYRRERAQDYIQPARYDRIVRYCSDCRYHDSTHRDSDGHYHPNGKYCRDGGHIAHLRDGYYRADRRWYRDGRYWNEYDWVNRYFGGWDRQGDDDDDDELMQGVVIGATVGITCHS